MHLKKSHVEIMNLYRKDIFLSRTIREVSFLLKKDYPNTYNSVMELYKNKIIKIKKVGKSSVCELNLNFQGVSLLSFLDEQEALSKKIPNIDKIMEFKEFLEDIIVISGSYSKNTQTLKSDIDLVIITKDDAFKKQKLLENFTALFHPRVHVIVITQKDFSSMLLDKKANFGREIFNSHFIFRGASRYYELVRGAIDNGFRG